MVKIEVKRLFYEIGASRNIQTNLLLILNVFVYA